MPVVPKNPFRVAERVRGPYFTGRAPELAAVVAAMRRAARLLVRGPARMGASSLLGVAAETVRAAGGVVLMVDLSIITGLAEAADRLLAAVSREASWRPQLSSWAVSLAPQVVLGWEAPDRPRLSVSGSSWPRSAEGEKALLKGVLKRLGEAGVGEGAVVVLDGLGRLLELGGESAAVLLREAMADGAMGWVCTGSGEALGSALERAGVLHEFFETMALGPIDAGQLGGWIDERMRGSGVASDGVGAAVVARAGPHTQDVVQVARALWFRSVLRGRALASQVEDAVLDVVRGQDAALRRTWSDLTPVQQRVLRALAAGAEQLFGAESRARFRLGPASSVGTAVATLERRRVLERGSDGVAFDSPFFRTWVQLET
ncbi:MAG: hypothetical protein P8099_07075 [Gemmatimonadota bacterium]